MAKKTKTRRKPLREIERAGLEQVGGGWMIGGGWIPDLPENFWSDVWKGMTVAPSRW